MDIETSVHTPRFGGPALSSYLGGGFDNPTYYCEADIDETLRKQVQERGINLDVVNPWNVHSGSYEGVHLIDGVGHACADPRRAGAAEAV
jgi:gamma-glutamyltranspeptidase / glutathione hydrolase